MIGFKRRMDVTALRTYKICAYITPGATPTITNGRGLLSCTQSGTGDYVVTLRVKAESLLSAQVTAVSTAALIVQLKALPAAPVASVEILSFNTSAAATDPTAGYYLELTCSEDALP